uniref:Uncharacterized protein n=1 Tax=Steinernema glaseri TaxID=37863 RepID=A0A1I7ZCS3_9BILA
MTKNEGVVKPLVSRDRMSSRHLHRSPEEQEGGRGFGWESGGKRTPLVSAAVSVERRRGGFGKHSVTDGVRYTLGHPRQEEARGNPERGLLRY